MQEVLRICRRAWRLLFAGIKCQGARGVLREREHVAHGDLVGAPFAAVAPVLGVDLVPLVVGLLAVAEAAELLVLADVQPELQHDDAVLGELRFEVVDLGVGPPPLVLARKTLEALDQHAAVPRAIVDRHAGPRAARAARNARGSDAPFPRRSASRSGSRGSRARRSRSSAGGSRRPCRRRPSLRRPTRSSGPRAAAARTARLSRPSHLSRFAS